jgi:hypothetical protein
MSDDNPYEIYKIPIVTGINDSPTEPNFEGNGRGPNGSYYTEKYNGLIDALWYQKPVFTNLSGNISSSTIEVGSQLVNPGVAINLSYSASNAINIQLAKFYAAGAAINDNSYTPGQILSYNLSSYTGEPNLYLRSASYTWDVRGTDTRGANIGGNASITVNWRYRTYWGYSTNTNVTDPTSLQGGSNSLTRPSAVSKPASASAYLYIFLPIGKTGLSDGWSPYNTFKVAGFNAVMSPVITVTQTRLAVPVVYNRYRLFYPTAGAFTLDLT